MSAVDNIFGGVDAWGRPNRDDSTPVAEAPHVPPPPNQNAAKQLRDSRERIRKQSALVAGFQGTNRTGGLGLLGQAETTTKSLLGS